jgi:hypothetical protein
MQKKTRFILALLCCFCAAPNAWAGKLDIDYLHPSPAKALGYSLVIPGAGYFYLSGHNPDKAYAQRGLLFLGLTVGAYLFTADKAKDNEHGMVLAGIGALAGIRLIEFSTVVDDAEGERFEKYKELVR